MNQSEKHDITSRHRSFKGCWTCKKKRVQCDEVRPACTKCTSRGLVCGGYEIRLRWGAGIASRGKYSGAAKPVKESIPAQSRRRWDMRGKGQKSPGGDGQGQPTLVAQPLHDQRSQESIDQSQSVAQRATVNILNTPWEPDAAEQISAINKHFEIPASLASLQATAHAYPGADATNQYPRKSGGRSILA
ncbi:hypothetical protein N7541_003954 [Penicillium brevicompactum]|uniref:Zn(2)-C6 fungal-type domain-containing protein n=1 Tax=Penicillium brevicompactum TaxID=5074 RepID=A0A9W9RMT5_PENBR|nr:hypothetical protein N7541_003954 [Penicillium brevicompactum]